MALVKSVLKNQIKIALLAEAGNDASQPQKESADRLATKLSNAIDAYIKTATVISSGANTAGPVPSTSTSIL